MSKLLRKDLLREDSSYQISQVAKGIDAQAVAAVEAAGLNLGDNILRFGTNGYIIHQRTTGGYLKIWGPDSSTDNKNVECINDGTLFVKGYHSLQLGTNEAGHNIGIGVFPTYTEIYGGDLSDYLRFFTSGNIPHIAVKGGSVLYFRESAGGAWETIHADDFVNESPPMPTELCTQDILKIKNKNGKLDHYSLPKDVLYEEIKYEVLQEEIIDPNTNEIIQEEMLGKEIDRINPGMRLGALVLHLTKTIQELNDRIENLEEVNKTK